MNAMKKLTLNHRKSRYLQKAKADCTRFSQKAQNQTITARPTL